MGYVKSTLSWRVHIWWEICHGLQWVTVGRAGNSQNTLGLTFFLVLNHNNSVNPKQNKQMVKILALWTAIFPWWAFFFVKNNYNIKILAPAIFWSCSMTYSCSLCKYPWILSSSICLHSSILLARDYSISRQSWEFIFYYLISRSLPLSYSGLFLEKMVGFHSWLLHRWTYTYILEKQIPPG